MCALCTRTETGPTTQLITDIGGVVWPLIHRSAHGCTSSLESPRFVLQKDETTGSWGYQLAPEDNRLVLPDVFRNLSTPRERVQKSRYIRTGVSMCSTYCTSVRYPVLCNTLAARGKGLICRVLRNIVTFVSYTHFVRAAHRSA